MSRKDVLFDVDGVVGNFVKAALKLHNATLGPTEVRWNFLTQIGFTDLDDPKFWEPMGRDFWYNIEPHADGMKVFQLVEDEVGRNNITFLTTPSKTPGCVQGKIDWIAKHFPRYSRRFMVTPVKEVVAGPGKILLDDYDGNLAKWTKFGGTAIQVPRSWNTGVYSDLFKLDGSFDAEAFYAQKVLPVLLS